MLIEDLLQVDGRFSWSNLIYILPHNFQVCHSLENFGSIE
jgi:hypothetical protein